MVGAVVQSGAVAQDVQQDKQFTKLAPKLCPMANRLNESTDLGLATSLATAEFWLDASGQSISPFMAGLAIFTSFNR
jgi:hypothetical protein